MTGRLRALTRRRSLTQVIGVVAAAAVLLVGAAASSGDLPTSVAAALPSSPSAASTYGTTALEHVTGPIPISRVQAAAPGVTISVKSLTIGGLDRAYLLISPAAQTGPLPMIMVLHGVNASPTGEVLRDEFLPLAQAGKAILVYPAGYEFSWNIGTEDCCGPAQQAKVDDVAFVKAVDTDVQADLPISNSYLVGFSNGGKLSYQVMCDEPDLFAAFAVVSATPLSTCNSWTQSAKSVLIAAGANDPELPTKLTAEPAARAIADTAALWRIRDSCTSTVQAETAAKASIQTWTGCSGGTSVTSVVYAGLAHAWPTLDAVGAADSGATLIWAFLSAQHA